MIKEGLPTRNRYVTSQMGAAFVAPAIRRPLREDGSRAFLLSDDRSSALDRESSRPSFGVVTGCREQVAA
jgi:hypothetical protein